MSKKMPHVAAEWVKMKEKKRPRFGRLPERGVIHKRLWRARHGMHVRVLYACAIHADEAGFFLHQPGYRRQTSRPAAWGERI